MQLKCLSLMFACLILFTVIPAARALADDDAGVADRVSAYFHTEDADVRKRIAAELDADPEATTDAVAAAIRNLQLWLPAEPGIHHFVIPNEEGPPTDVVVHVPRGYDPQKRWPVLIGLHGTGGNGEAFQRFVRRILGGRENEFIVACPTELRGDTFYDSETEGDQPFVLVRELRRRYHVDSDRVYVTGYSLGGHGSMFLSLMHGDLFAAGIPMAGTLVVPQRDRLFPHLLPNLKNTPVLLVWGEDDTGGPGGASSPTGGIAGENRLVGAAADRLGLPLTAIELKGVGHANVSPSAELWHDTLGMTRPRYPAEVSQRCRYLGQAHNAWLRARKFNGKAWTGNTLPPVQLKQGDNPDEKILAAIIDKLRSFSGKVDGQQIELDSHRISRLEVLLSDEMINLDEPIVITVRGKKTFEGKVKRKPSVMLEEAARTWDFDRLYEARLVMKGSGRIQEK